MDIQITTILFQIVNFSVVVGALTVLLYKPVLKIFDERSKRIAEGQKAAEEALKQRDAIDSLKARTKAEMEQERLQMLATAQKEAQVKRQEIIDKAHEEAKAVVAAAHVQIQAERAKLLTSTKKSIYEAVVVVTQRVIGKSLSSADHTKLIDSEIDTILKSL